MRRAICPGSFNPVTLGHIDLFERAAGIFDEVVVLVTYNSEKIYPVSAELRLHLIQTATDHIPNLKVKTFKGLVADYAMEKNIRHLVKGIRDGTDADYELQIAYVNKMVTKELVDTMFLPTKAEYVYISSSIVREIASYGGDISRFVPEVIEEEIRKLYR